MDKRDEKNLQKLNAYLHQRDKQVFGHKAVRAAILQRINRLSRIAGKMETNDSPGMRLSGHQLYALEVEIISRELHFLFHAL